jgi:hypothetical protein
MKGDYYKHEHETMEKEYRSLNEIAKKRSGHITISKNLLKEDPHTIHIDGIRAKETPTIMGEKT